jgi:hypothetical protein
MTGIKTEVRKKKDKEDEKKDLETDKTTLVGEISTILLTDNPTIDGDIATLIGEISTIQRTDIPAKITEINAKEIIVEQVKENFELNKVEILKANNSNR